MILPAAWCQQQEQFSLNTLPTKLVACTGFTVDDKEPQLATGKLEDYDIKALIDYAPSTLLSHEACIWTPAKADLTNPSRPEWLAGATDVPKWIFYREASDTTRAISPLATYNANSPQPDERVTIVHILRWADTQHQNVKFQKWYVYDPHRPNPWMYFKADSANELGTYIDGRQFFRLVVIHLDSVLTNEADSSNAESFYPDLLPAPLPADWPAGAKAGGWRYPVQYKISIAQTQTQLQQDVVSLAQIMGYMTPAKAAGAAAPGKRKPQEMGYFWVYDFNSSISTSTITLAVTLTDERKAATKAKPGAQDSTACPSTDTANASAGASGKTAGKSNASAGASKKTAAKSKTSADANTTAASKPAKSANNTTACESVSTANNIASQSYHNEKPAWFGLGVAVPVTSYRDLTYTNNLLTPTTVTRQNVYVTGNFYLPPTEVGSTTLRWLPHPFVGLPIKGQPLRNSVYGIATGWRWFEPFWGIVLDVQQVPGAAPNTRMNHYIRKGVYGLNISVSALAKALSSSSKSTSTTK